MKVTFFALLDAKPPQVHLPGNGSERKTTWQQKGAEWSREALVLFVRANKTSTPGLHQRDGWDDKPTRDKHPGL